MMATNTPHAYLFADGSSARKDDIGAWASFVVTKDARKLLYGVNFPTTITRCELLPIIEGLRWIKGNWAKGAGFRVRVTSDSEYTVKTLNGLYERRKNTELWAAVDEASKGMHVTYVWRERNTMPYMTLCDGVCGMLRRQTINLMSRLAEDPRRPEEGIPVEELPKDIDTIQIEGANT
jgi:ribonuclease HI